MQEPKEETVKPHRTRNKTPVNFKDIGASVKNLKTMSESNRDTTAPKRQ